MADASYIELTINFNDPDLELEEQNELVQGLMLELKDMDGLEAVDRIHDPNPPQGNKSSGGFLVGLLMAEVTAENFNKLITFLGDRLGNKPIKLKIKAPDGRELEIETRSRKDFEFAIQKAQQFLDKE